MPTMTAFRDPVEAPLRKLSVDLIKTYKHINEVRSFLIQSKFFFSFVLLDDLEMRKTITIISLYLRVFVLFFSSHTYTTL